MHLIDVISIDHGDRHHDTLVDLFFIQVRPQRQSKLQDTDIGAAADDHKRIVIILMCRIISLPVWRSKCARTVFG